MFRYALIATVFSQAMTCPRTVEEALPLALQRMHRSDSRGLFVIDSSLTTEHPFGWVFVPARRSRRPNEQVFDEIPTLGPIAVRRDGTVALLPSSFTPEQAVAEFTLRWQMVTALKRPGVFLERLCAVDDSDPSGPWVLRFESGDYRLPRRDDKLFRFWAATLPKLLARGDALYVVADPETKTISSMALSTTWKVTAVAREPVNGRLEVTFQISAARHYLDMSRPGAGELRQALERAAATGAALTVAEDAGGSEILAIRGANPGTVASLPNAYAFDSALSLDQMLSALNSAGPWKWTARDSDTYGDYLLARPDDGPTRIRIIESRGRYLLDVGMTVRPEKRTLSRAEIEQILFDRVFPAAQARAITPASGL